MIAVSGKGLNGEARMSKARSLGSLRAAALIGVGVALVLGQVHGCYRDTNLPHIVPPVGCRWKRGRNLPRTWRLTGSRLSNQTAE